VELSVFGTIDQTIQLLALLLFASTLLAVFAGWRQVVSARSLPYFLLRQSRTMRGWRWILLGFGLGVLALIVQFYGRPIAYRIVPPTPSATPTATITQTPTITLTPTITATPSITLTPSISPTGTATSTPALPETIRVLIRETVTPAEDAALSPIQVARRIDGLNRAINPDETFENPIGRLYGAFTYNNLQNGLRWTSLWLHGDEVICIESQAWDGDTGGFGYTECEPERWLPGDYEIRMFLGERWRVSASFRVEGEPPTPTPTPSPSPTSSNTPTP
jgi:hypothetical protein